MFNSSFLVEDFKSRKENFEFIYTIIDLSYRILSEYFVLKNELNILAVEKPILPIMLECKTKNATAYRWFKKLKEFVAYFTKLNDLVLLTPSSKKLTMNKLHNLRKNTKGITS